MKACLTALYFCAASLAFQAPAASLTEVDRKLLSSIRTEAEKGDAKSQFEMGSALYLGKLGLEKNASEAAKWWRMAAEQDFAPAQNNLAVCFALGQGVMKDASESAKWYRKAAEQNYALSQSNLGACYASGQGVEKDYEEAVRWYRKAIEQNHPLAQSNLGFCYANGQGVGMDYVEAVKWYRKAADQNLALAQYNLGFCYRNGRGLVKDDVEAVAWYRRAAEQDYFPAQSNLGLCYQNGWGMRKNAAEAVRWYRRAAEQNYAMAQHNLAVCYENGDGVLKDQMMAVSWYRKAAEQNYGPAQSNLGFCYAYGEGVSKDLVTAYKWWSLAAAQGRDIAKKNIPKIEVLMTAVQISRAQLLAHEFKPLAPPAVVTDIASTAISESRSESSGTGFFITEDGYFITHQRIAGEGARVRLVTEASLIAAMVVKVDKANDLALLKAEGKFTALPVITSRGVRLGATAITVGFPNIGLQGFAPKLAKGEIASLAGAQDDARHFQISAPIQPGNSGGALVDERGNVIGVVVAKLNQKAALATSGTLAENVNYAVKSSFLLGFLESVPEVAAKLKEPTVQARKFEDVVRAVEQAAVLVLVY